MSELLISLFKDQIIIENVTAIKEFSSNSFKINILDIPYEICGENMVLEEVLNNNSKIKIVGKISSINMESNKPKNKTIFLKKLFS